ncbi:PREDICTED: putative inorganic phosphate cotransporter [Nicrophorus vespilloides]|uniref:Inorganic phosphate cotransporter n=1 Tax=Nicrophorus vespilloides TaxID=110193 RepID=A0ABM1M336_NICVS|nr:PREDICTED: putative inorganic phosphate cotransporter [Nicrophorus vespilloides]
MENPTRRNICGKWISARYLLATLGSLGMAIVYGLKVNLSVAIVSMVNHTALRLSNPINEASSLTNDDSCLEPASNSSSSFEDGPFTWPGTMQGAMLSSYFWGYIIAQIPGGRIAELFSAKWTMFFAVAVNVAGTILTPPSARIHFGAALAMRIAEGIGGGVTFPAMHVMLARWAPPKERSVMSNLVYAGTALGTVVSMLSTGVIAASLGWESVFYIMGGFSCVWLVLWGILIADSPEEQTFIDDDEREYIIKSLGPSERKQKLPVPWKSVLTSPAFVAIFIAHTCNNWGWYMVLIELPIYMKSVLKFKITENAVLTAIPFLSMWIFSMILSRTLDVLRGKGVIDTTRARKIATLIASVVPAFCFLLLSYIGCQKIVAVVLMTLAVTAVGGMFCGFLSNHIDIAPNYAGTLMALTNTAATIPGIIVPIFVGKLIQTDPSINSWRIIFWTTIILYTIEIIVYGLFGSGEQQPWNNTYSHEAVEVQPLKQSPTESQNYESTEKAFKDSP